MDKNEVIRRAEARLSKTVSLTDDAMAEELREHFPEAFKEDKPLNRWYVEEGEDKLCIFEGKKERYGINRIEEWFKSERVYEGINETLRLATDEEILERLSAYATKMGYKEGVKVKCIEAGFVYTLGICQYRHCDGRFYLDGTCVMKDGKWAEIVEEPKQEPIHPLERAIKDLEARVGKLESDYALYKLC